MKTRLLILAATGLSAVALSGCDYNVSGSDGPPPPPPVEAPAVEDVATDASAPVEEAPQQPAPPVSDTGDMGDARSSEESVEPDSETVFY